MLAEHGYTIATGLAEGSDAAAAEGALSAGGNVIGVVRVDESIQVRISKERSTD